MLEVSAHVALHLLQRGRLAGRGGGRTKLRSNRSSRGRGQRRGPRGSKCRNRARVGDGGRRRGDLPFALAGVICSESGGDDGDLYFFFHLLVEHGAEDDVGIFVRGALNNGGGFVHLRQAQRGGAGDVDENAARAINRSRFQQRGSNRGLRRLHRAPLALGGGGAHDGESHARHDGFHVGEIAVDDAGNGDDVGNSLHRLAQNVVGHAERFEESGVLRHRQQPLVGDDDERIHRFDELGQAFFRLLQAPLAFERERFGHDGHRERAHFAGQRGDDRRRARAGASAQAGGDKNHVGAFQRLDDLVGILQRALAADFRIGARAQSVGQLHA